MFLAWHRLLLHACTIEEYIKVTGPLMCHMFHVTKGRVSNAKIWYFQNYILTAVSYIGLLLM